MRALHVMPPFCFQALPSLLPHWKVQGTQI